MVWIELTDVSAMELFREPMLFSRREEFKSIDLDLSSVLFLFLKSRDADETA